MQFQLALLVASVVAAAYAPLSVHAADCSAAQQAAANVLGGAEFETACADVFKADSASDASLDPAKLLAANASSLNILAPCKQPSCAAFLKKQADKVPDCELAGVNTRVVFKTIVDFCSDAKASPASNVTSTAPMTASEKKDKAKGKTGSSSGSGSGNGSGSGSKSGPTMVKITPEMAKVPSPDKSMTPEATTATPNTAGNSDNDKKATNANTKSDANSAAFAGATAIIAGALLTVLSM